MPINEFFKNYIFIVLLQIAESWSRCCYELHFKLYMYAKMFIVGRINSDIDRKERPNLFSIQTSYNIF